MSITPRFTAGFQRYAPEMENGCAGTGVTSSDLAPWHMDETYVKVNGRWRICPVGAVDSRGCTVDFISSRRKTAKLHTGFGQNPQQREEVADPAIHQHG